MKKTFFTKKQSTAGGFLLVELIVALFIFSLVMVVAIGSLISAFDANKKAQSLQSVMNNLNLAMEEMTKSLAVGKQYACNSDSHGTGVLADDCPAGPSSTPLKKISFTSQDGMTVTYEFIPKAGSVGGYITRKIGSGSALRLTANEIDIDVPNSGFYVTGATSFTNSDTVQPSVAIVIKGTAQAGPRNTTSFSVQTMVSQRIPDFN